ncbi:MAG TPA: TRAP transporter small permease [Candidatus Atribacteria bacterium]|nr:TRAP transporter small permease [Candidatus Atribacteria bacterium]
MFLKIVNKIYSVVKIIEENLVIILLAIMVSNVAIGVFYRYILNNSLSWTEELARYLMVWFAYIGMAMAFRDESHVNVSFLVNYFPLIYQHIIKIVSYLLVLFFLITLFTQSLSVFRIVKIQTSPSVQIPMIYPYLSVTFGALLMAIEVVYIIFKNICAVIKK